MRDMYRQMYKQKYDVLLTREQGKIMYRIYNSDDGHDSHYIHFKIPSETLAGLYYDTVVKLWTNDNNLKESASFREHFVKFFSNDSAFVFTFAHAFRKNGLFITELEQRMNKIALRDKAIVRNPKDDIWYVKSLCFAYYTMDRYNLFSRSVSNQFGVKYSIAELLRNVKSVDDKIIEREAIEKEQRKNNKDKLIKTSERQLANRKFIASTADTPRSISYTRTMKNTKRTRKSNNIRYAKKV